MTDRGQLDEIPAQLFCALQAAVPAWLERCVVATATARLGRCPDDVADAAAEMARREAPAVLDQLHRLLAADVDEQRRAPLAILRDAVTSPSGILSDAGVPAPDRDEFEQRAFPDDRYALSPASWSDVDPALSEPGIMWGAWKAATVLDRRRTEGAR